MYWRVVFWFLELFWFLIFVLFYVYFANIFLGITCMPGTNETWRKCQVSWNWSGLGCTWAAMWVVWTNLRSSERAANALSLWDISPALVLARLLTWYGMTLIEKRIQRREVWGQSRTETRGYSHLFVKYLLVDHCVSRFFDVLWSLYWMFYFLSAYTEETKVKCRTKIA